ncbi:MAG: hypothetical protein ABI977_32105 [Acidobacteriota bacterium]
MAYSNFTLAELEKRFGLDIVPAWDMFKDVPAETISNHLAETLEESVPLALAIGTEKAKSEWIVAPMLSELRKLFNHQVSIFSGTEFNVDAENGLTGTCDFLITHSTQQLTIEAPVITLVEAKNDNLKSGLPQCLAEMVAAQKFNERENSPIDSIFGAVTTGSAWNFIKLIRRTAYVDWGEYSIENPGKILGILKSMIESSCSSTSTGANQPVENKL